MTKHPKLAKKFKLLYQLKARPDITSNQKLANLLGVSRQSVSKWSTGGGTQSGDAIPDAHFFRIGSLFGIDSYLFTLGYEEFEKEVRLLLDRRNRARRRRPHRIFRNNLTQAGGELLGRESELKRLDEAWNHGAANVIQIAGIGGVGKSALLGAWLAAMETDAYRNAETVFLWSFHHGCGSAGGAPSTELFFSRALSAFAGAKFENDDPESRVLRLLREIRKCRTLLVLDGVQNLQHCYGPNFGQFADPAFALLLRELVKENPGLCLIGSRLKNPELEAVGAPRALCLQLQGLRAPDARKLLQSRGVSGEANQFGHALGQHEGLPLSLQLLGKHLELVGDGNLVHYMEMGPLMEESGESESAARWACDYLDRLPLAGQRKFFYLLSLFGRPTRLAEVLKTCRFRSVDGLTEDILGLTRMELRYGIFALERAGVVRVHRQQDGMLLQLSQFAGEAIAQAMKRNLPAQWLAGNQLLFDRIRQKNSGSRPSAQSRESLYHAVVNGIRCKSWEEAFDLYFRRLRDGCCLHPPPGFRYLDQACLRGFFTDPWSRLQRGVGREESRVTLRFCAAVNLAGLGDIQQATALARACLKWFLARQCWSEALAAACLLLGMLLVVGKLPDAARWAERVRKRLARGGDPVTIASSEILAANVLFLRGKSKKAGELFRRADRSIASTDPARGWVISLVEFNFCRYLLDTGGYPSSLERSISAIAGKGAGTWRLARHANSVCGQRFSLLSLVLHQQGDSDDARRSLDQQIELLRDSPEWLCLAVVLNFRARLFIEAGNFSAAHSDLDQALGIARRLAANAIEWDSLLNLALLCSRNAKREQGKRYLESAKGVAGMDAFRFRDGEIRELERSLAA